MYTSTCTSHPRIKQFQIRNLKYETENLEVVQEYGWAITQEQGCYAVTEQVFSVLVFGFQLGSLANTYTVQYIYNKFQPAQNSTCARFSGT